LRHAPTRFAPTTAHVQAAGGGVESDQARSFAVGVAIIGCFDLRVCGPALREISPYVELLPVRAVNRRERDGSASETTAEPTTTGSVTGQRMRAITQTEYGTADVLRLAEIERPAIGADEALVKVRAAGLDRGTWHLMAGMPYAARLAVGLRAPKNLVPGLDAAGVVVAVGTEVTRFQPGDEVFGVSKGSFAEFAAARESKLARKPSNLSFEQAAAVPVSGMTALRGLTDVGNLQTGQKVLIIGASGGVGSYAVQIAKALGAEVTGVCSTGKLDLVRSIGADHVIDYNQEDFANGNTRYDLILDTGGNSTLSRLRRALTARGTLVIVGGEGGGRVTGMGRQLRALALSPFVGQRLTMLGPKEHYTILERLTELIEGGQLVPAIEQTYPLDEMPNAMRHLQAGRARGKLVITVSST
jgi:NADPH:quinone reductase-like Zn-dependent oxidoreductase